MSTEAISKSLQYLVLLLLSFLQKKKNVARKGNAHSYRLAIHV